MIRGRTLHIKWHVNDIIYRAEDRGFTLTVKQAKEILKDLDRNHDANIGVNWDTIDIVTDYYLEYKE